MHFNVWSSCCLREDICAVVFSGSVEAVGKNGKWGCVKEKVYVGMGARETSGGDGRRRGGGGGRTILSHCVYPSIGLVMGFMIGKTRRKLL